MKTTKYHSQKNADKQHMSHITTLRYDEETKQLLDEECKKSQLSQSQVIRKLIRHEHAAQTDIRNAVLSFRDRLNHLAHIVTAPEDKNTLAILEDEYRQIQQQLLGGN